MSGTLVLLSGRCSHARCENAAVLALVMQAIPGPGLERPVNCAVETCLEHLESAFGEAPRAFLVANGMSFPEGEQEQALAEMFGREERP